MATSATVKVIDEDLYHMAKRIKPSKIDYVLNPKKHHEITFLETTVLQRLQEVKELSPVPLPGSPVPPPLL